MPILTKIFANKILFGIFLLGIFAVGFSSTYFLLTLTKPQKQNEDTAQSDFSKATPAPVNEVNPEKGVYNILLLGHGGTGHPGGLLTDSIIIARIDTNSKEVFLITIPRDLWVPGNHKINAAGVSVGFQNVGAELQNVTGLPINYYIAIDFGNFVKLVDSLGGITVNLPNSFSDTFYPIRGLENDTCGKTAEEINNLKARFSGFELEKQFVCRYEALSFNKGEVNLNGETALKIVRSRHGDSDFGRSQRQLAVLEGTLNKLISFQSAGKINEIIGSLLGLVKTDLNAGIIKTFVEVVGDPKGYSVKQFQLTTQNVLTESKSQQGAYILIPKAGTSNFTEVKTFIRNNLN